MTTPPNPNGDTALHNAALDFYNGQKNYYSSSSSTNKRNYWALRSIIIVGGTVVVPGLLLFAQVPDWLPALCSLVVGGLAGLEGLFNFGETWVAHRRNAELLRQEKLFYDVNGGAYAEMTSPAEKDRLFAERVAAIVSSEVSVTLEEVLRDVQASVPTVPRGGTRS